MKKVFFTLFFTLFLCVFSNAQNIEVIETELQNVLNQKSNDLIDVNIYFKSQVNANQLTQKTRRVNDKEIKRNVVVSELKNLTEGIQADVLSVLKAEELNGKVVDINCLWIANSINCKATSDVIYKLSSHPDIKVLGYNKEIQVLSPEEAKEVSKAEVEKLRATAAHHILTINADHVWEQGYTGKNVVVAVLDSGTNIEHKDIESNLWEGEVDGNLVNGWNFIADNEDISDDNGHGTHCAGIVCGNGTSGTSTGVAPDAKLMTVKIVGGAGTGTPADMLSGVQFAVENGANILSMSLGFKKTQLSVAQIEAIRTTFDNALTSGVIVCAAAGNDGNSWGAPNNVDYPAACPAPWSNPDQTLKGGLSSVVCVGGSDLIGSSSQGPSTWEETSYNDYPYNEGASMGLIRPDISAPGNLLYSLNHLQSDKYRMLSGTSQSTPVVAGVMALMLEKNSSLTPAQISEIIETTAASKPATKNNVVGAGRVDALAAVNAVAEGTRVPYIKFESVAPQVITQGDAKTITVKVKNVGKGSSAAATSATLSLANDEYVTIPTPTVALGQISAGNTKDVEFVINVNAQTPNGHVANFTLSVTSGDYTWEYPLSVKITSTPDVVFSSVTPGSINVNQDVNINVTMKNNGTAAMNGNTELTLSALSGDLKYITIVDNSATVGSMEVGGTSTGSFTIRANGETPHNYRVDFFMETYSKSEEETNLVYEFESDNEGWTSFAATNNIAEPWWHSTSALEHGKKGKDSYSGKGHLMSETVGMSSVEYASPIDNYLVSPTKILATENTEVSFYARAHHAAYYKEHFGLAVSTNGNTSAGDFTMLQDWTITSEQRTSWNKYTVDLGAYAGQEIYVAIRHFFTNAEWNDPSKADKGHGVDALNIDDILFTNVLVDNHSVPTYSGDDKNMFSIYVYNMKELAAVKNLVATASSTSAIALTWDAVEDAQSYNIYRDGAKIANVKTNSYEDSNLTHNTTYNYTVAAVYSNVEFEHSNEASATTQQIQYSAVIKDFTQDVVYIDGETSVDFKLTILNDGANQFKARAYYTLTSDSDYVTITNNATDLLKALTSGEEATKTINVRFSENTPNKSVINFNLNILSMITDPTQADYYTFDLPFSVTIKNDPKAPKGLTVKNYSDNSVTFNWNTTSNAISYNVYRNGALIGYTSSTSYYDSELEPETEYYYEVTSVTEEGESEKSERLVVTTMAGNSEVSLQSFELAKTSGETTLTATFINKGTSATPATTTATLKTEDTYVTIVDGTADLGSIAVNGTTTATFTIKIADNVPYNYTLDFDVDVEYESGGTGGTVTRTYTFDNDLDGFTTITADNHNWYHSSNQSAHGYNKSYSTTPSGGGFIFSESYCNKGSGFDPDHWIIIPEQIVPSDLTTFEFYACSMSSSNNYADETFGVFVSTTNNTDANAFTEVGKWTLAKNSNSLKMALKSAMLIDYEDQKIWVAIRHYGAGDNAALAVDDVTIYNIKVSSLVTNTSSFSVSVNPSVNTFNGSGAWNLASNWSKGSTPVIGEDVIINGDATIESGNVTAKSITINSGSLTVNSGATLTVNGALLNKNANAFIIEDGAQVFQNNDNVYATFNMLIDRPTSWGNDHQGGWQFISSPITNAKIDGFKPESETDYDLFKYDGTQELQWINHKNHGTDFETTFQQGRGYIVSYEAETSADFEGIINNAKAFTFTDVKAFDAENHYNNFYLLGNPFMFNMDWTNMTVSDVYNGYATISNVDGSYDYHTSGTINVGDGFMVKSIGSNPELTYNHNTRARIEKYESLDISASNIYGSDNVIVKLAGQEEEGFTKLDNLNENIAEIYVENRGTKYGIFSFDENVNEVKLGFRPVKTGTHIIRINADGNFEYITLVDNVTGKEVDMLKGEYAFTVYSTEEERDRFSVKFSKKANMDESNFVYQSGDELIIEGNGSLQIIDVMGRVIYNDELNGNARINVGHLDKAVYIVRRIDGNNVNSQKILVF